MVCESQQNKFDNTQLVAVHGHAQLLTRSSEIPLELGSLLSNDVIFQFTVVYNSVTAYCLTEYQHCQFLQYWQVKTINSDSVTSKVQFCQLLSKIQKLSDLLLRNKLKLTIHFKISENSLSIKGISQQQFYLTEILHIGAT